MKGGTFEMKQRGAYYVLPKPFRRENQHGRKFWSKQAIQELVKENQFESVEQIQATMKEMFKDVLEATLKAELDTQLAYAPYDQNKETKNSRNGYRQKTVHTEYGDLPIQVPRDRLGEFEPVVIK